VFQTLFGENTLQAVDGSDTVIEKALVYGSNEYRINSVLKFTGLNVTCAMKTLEITGSMCVTAAVRPSIECPQRVCSVSFLVPAAASIMHYTNYCLLSSLPLQLTVDLVQRPWKKGDMFNLGELSGHATVTHLPIHLP
jgi:hypothetical protein